MTLFLSTKWRCTPWRPKFIAGRHAKGSMLALESAHPPSFCLSLFPVHFKPQMPIRRRSSHWPRPLDRLLLRVGLWLH
ncbi:MAG: hypothetical protein QOK11_4219 [Pseudonocardiales bacterium]|nr:hypothetical protein [Pseudonocardiales bacterium]